MKGHCLVLIIILVCCISILNAQAWHIEVTSVSTQEITADLSVINNTNDYIDWVFYRQHWATLMLDWLPAEYAVQQDWYFVGIPVGSTWVEHLRYTRMHLNPPELIPNGTHIVQACRKFMDASEPEWIPVGNVVFIDVSGPTLITEYELVVNSVSQKKVSATLNITNNSLNPINWDHDYDFWVGLFIDDGNYFSSIDPAPEFIQIPADSTFSLPLNYIPYSDLIPAGEHVLQAKRYNYAQQMWEPVGNPVNVTISGPVSTDDANMIYTQLSAYPNPFHGNISIAYQAKKPAVTDIRIYNTKGQLINSYKATAKSGENTISWNGKDARGSNVPAGIYIISLKDGNQSDMIKCIKIDN